jgi:hypothetical protein
MYCLPEVHTVTVLLVVVGALVEGAEAASDSASSADSLSGGQSSSELTSEFSAASPAVVDTVVAALSVASVVLVVVVDGVVAFLDVSISGELGPLSSDPVDAPLELTRTSAQLKNSSGVKPTAVQDFCFGCAPVAPPSHGHPAHADGYL